MIKRKTDKLTKRDEFAEKISEKSIIKKNLYVVFTFY